MSYLVVLLYKGGRCRNEPHRLGLSRRFARCALNQLARGGGDIGGHSSESRWRATQVCANTRTHLRCPVGELLKGARKSQVIIHIVPTVRQAAASLVPSSYSTRTEMHTGVLCCCLHWGKVSGSARGMGGECSSRSYPALDRLLGLMDCGILLRHCVELARQPKVITGDGVFPSHGGNPLPLANNGMRTRHKVGNLRLPSSASLKRQPRAGTRICPNPSNFREPYWQKSGTSQRFGLK